MYIVFFEPIFSIKHFLRYPLKWVIKLFSQSKFNHVAHTIEKNGVTYIAESKGKGYRHLELEESLVISKSILHAYKVKKKFNKENLQKFEASMLGKKYDLIGAIYSEAHHIPILNKIFKRKKNDQKVFCSEAELRMCVALNFIPNIYNPNEFSPQEYLELLKSWEIINLEPEIWQLDEKKS